jgi:hypothetical protein
MNSQNNSFPMDISLDISDVKSFVLSDSVNPNILIASDSIKIISDKPVNNSPRVHSNESYMGLSISIKDKPFDLYIHGDMDNNGCLVSYGASRPHNRYKTPVYPLQFSEKEEYELTGYSKANCPITFSYTYLCLYKAWNELKELEAVGIDERASIL